MSGIRLSIQVEGVVQGIGFRPFVYRLAMGYGLVGWVQNTVQGVHIEVEGPPDGCHAFVQQLSQQAPSLAVIADVRVGHMPSQGDTAFSIKESREGTDIRTMVLPDIAMCAACAQELLDPWNRRYRYPFINCTHCGPRYSIITALPYDRKNTTMNAFTMCTSCREEYEMPDNRRFHAQPNACPACGPRVVLWHAAGHVLCEEESAVSHAVEVLRAGHVLAVKGLGGFHLMADAQNAAAVEALRRRKQRPHKPFAVMFPSLPAIETMCLVSAVERTHLQSPAASIVFVQSKAPGGLAAAVAPDNPYVGAVLPYTPLHHLLLHDMGGPLVATSGNVSGEPLCVDMEEAVLRLSGIADMFLTHNRPIAQPVDDSVLFVAKDTPVMVRRALGVAPLPYVMEDSLPALVAVGAQLKHTVALTVGKHIVLSPHIGDMGTSLSVRLFQETVRTLERLYAVQPDYVVCDMHPSYYTTQYAESLGKPCVKVQHHHAHIVACMAEHHLDEPVLGIAWDGTGYGPDGTLWGGEFLCAERHRFVRKGHIKTFPLPGGEAAIREPRRIAFGLLYTLYGQALFDNPAWMACLAASKTECRVWKDMIATGLNTPQTSGMGRLCDGVSSLLGVCHYSTFEGQAAQALGYACLVERHSGAYPLPICDIMNAQGKEMWVCDWQPTIAAIVQDIQKKKSIAAISSAFHNALVNLVVAIAHRENKEKVVLSGGCFQNRYLLEGVIDALRRAGFSPYFHRDVPMNDGGIALGQAVVAAYGLTRNTVNGL